MILIELNIIIITLIFIYLISYFIKNKNCTYKKMYIYALIYYLFVCIIYKTNKIEYIKSNSVCAGINKCINFNKKKQSKL